MIQWLNEWGQHWLLSFGPLVIQNTLFLGLTFLALWIIRNGTAKIKYAIAMVGLIKCLLPSFSHLFNNSHIEVPVTVAQMIPVEMIEVTQPAKMTLSVHGFIFLVWLIFVLILFFIPVLSTIRLTGRLKNSNPDSIEGQDFTLKNVQLFKSKLIGMPLTLGLFPRRIYLPETWDNWSPKFRTMILQHEMAHINRKDGLIHFLQIIVQALYFFHPLVWFLSRKINELREMACDDVTVGQNHSSVEYSRALVEIAEKMVQTPLGCSSASALIRQKRELLTRVKYQMEDSMKKIPKRRIWLVSLCLLLLIIPLSISVSGINKSDLGALDNMTNQPNDIRTGTIKGQVFNTKTGEPVNNAIVSIVEKDFHIKTDKDGFYTLPNLKPGKYELKSSKFDYKTIRITDVVVKEAGTGVVNIHLSPILLTRDENESPTPEDDESPVIAFVRYDIAPKPVGGYKAIYNKLEYPKLAIKAGIEGKVLVYALIDKNGNVVQTKVEKSIGDGSNGCDEAAIEAIRKTKWKPALKDNKPVEVWILVPIKFNLTSDKE